MTVDIFKIRWTKVTSHRFDSTSFKKAMPELYGQFTKQTESPPLLYRLKAAYIRYISKTARKEKQKLWRV